MECLSWLSCWTCPQLFKKTLVALRSTFPLVSFLQLFYTSTFSGIFCKNRWNITIFFILNIWLVAFFLVAFAKKVSNWTFFVSIPVGTSDMFLCYFHLESFFKNIFFYFFFSFIFPFIWCSRAYFRKAGHACSMDEKGHFLVNLGQFEHETP